MKRFRINYNSYSGRPSANKFNGMIDYPERLDIAPFMVDPEVSVTIMVERVARRGRRR